MDFSPGTVFAGYRIDEQIGRGGMSVLYRATDATLGRSVALKVMAPDLSDDAGFRQRFTEEARTASQIDHPNVVPIYASGEHDGRLFIAMRFVPGTDLRRLLVANGALDLDSMAAVLTQLVAALEAVHQKGLVHRDVKPANVMLTDESGSGLHVYLTDFGLSRGATATGMTDRGQLLGTIAYASPEQLQGEPVDARSDVYALGCLLYECLTGARPFDRDNEAALLYAHLNAEVPAVSATRADVPPDLDAVVRTAMAKDREDRFASCAALLDAFQGVIGSDLEATRSVPVAATVAAAVAGAASVGTPSDGATTHAAVDEDADTVVKGGGGSGGRDAPASHASGGRRRLAAAGAIAVAVLLIGFFVLRASGDDDRGAEVTSGDSTTSTLEVREGDVSGESVPVEVDGVRITRASVLRGPDGDAVSTSLSFENSNDERVAVAHYEVIPKSMAADAEQISFDASVFRVVEADPVLGALLTVEPGATETVVYEVTTDAGPVAVARLEEWDAEREIAAAAFLEANQDAGALTTVRKGGATDELAGGLIGGDGGTGGDTEADSDTDDGRSSTTRPTTGPTVAPTTSPTTTPTTKQTTVVVTPSAPRSVTVANPSAPGTISQTPDDVTVTVSWSPPSSTGGGAIQSYEIRAELVAQNGGVAWYSSTTAGSGDRSRQVTVPRSDLPSSYYRYFVTAFNSAGPSTSSTAQVKMPNLVGVCSWRMYQLARVIGIRPQEVSQGPAGDSDGCGGALTIGQEVPANSTVPAGTASKVYIHGYPA